MQDTQIPSNATSGWNKVVTALRKHLHQPDTQAARIIYAAVAAHRFKGAPVWPMVIAPPGSAKTVLVEALGGLPGMNVHLIDTVTPQTFISGQIPDPNNPSPRSASLLLRIGNNGIIVVCDFSTVLTGKNDNRDRIFADLRRIYDGQLRKEYGTASTTPHEWSGRLTLLAAVTPEVDRYTSVFQALGERFLQVRWPRADGIDAALAAMNQDTQQAKVDLHDALQDLFGGLPGIVPQLPSDIERRIAALAEFTVIARTHVQRTGYGNKDITDVPQPESPTRLSQQLAQLAKGSALLDGHDIVTDGDYRLVQRAAFDNIKPVRHTILEALVFGPSHSGKLKKIPASTKTYATEDLEALGLLEITKASGHKLSDLACELLEQAGYSIPLGSRVNAPRAA